MASHDELGKKGEQLALDHLLSKGLVLVERNLRIEKDEIDLVFSNEDELVFVEVKTRENTFAGDPETLVSVGQQRRIIRAADKYIQEKDLDVEARFDIVGIVHNSKYTNIVHIEEAFSPRW
jgi:putative endonuclease